MYKKNDFNHNLLEWYQSNKRSLPWRETTDPYKIWLSEVMLQQTQVITVIPYYKKFITKYPSLSDLAEAEEEALLKDWEGLGYYNRIRNFHSAIKEVNEKYGAEVPGNPDLFFKLKGVGPYIGGAVQSIAFNHLLAAVDGNVLRVMSRLNQDARNMTKANVQKSIKEDIEDMMPLEAGDFNQALMELGATICTPRAPKCVMCPVQEHCEAYHHHSVFSYPVKQKKKKKQEESYNVYFILNDKEEVILSKQENSLLQGMYEFPKFDVDTSIEAIEEEMNLTLDQPNIHVGSEKHVFTHKVWYMEAYILYTTSENEHFVLLKNVRELPMSKAMQKLFDLLQF
jgi:A/G-specific adenine glycosylase